jgi:nickel superoxide dismutase
MIQLTGFFAKVISFAKPSVVYAHCDIPCGLYETDTMVHAADTVRIMVEKISAMQLPENGLQKTFEFDNTLARMVAVKEKHAQLCKEQLLILWTDYFKEEHLAKFPDLHPKIWKAAKLCSQAKRTVDKNVALQLIDTVAEIAKIFADSKVTAK